MDYKFDISRSTSSLAYAHTTPKPIFSCSKDFEKLALQLMVREKLFIPRTIEDCRALYDDLLRLINNI